MRRAPPAGLPEPFARFRGFADQGVEVTVAMPVGPFTDQVRLAHEFVKAAHARLAAEGISIRHLPPHVAQHRPAAGDTVAAEPSGPRRA